MSKKTKVLLVEDEQPLNDAFTTMLRKDGYDVLSAYDGEEALEILDKNKVDVVLLDILMPNVDGREFLKRYEADEDRPYIVAFSNLDAKDEINEILELGADRYILKSWATPKELSRVVEEIVK